MGRCRWLVDLYDWPRQKASSAANELRTEPNHAGADLPFHRFDDGRITGPSDRVSAFPMEADHIKMILRGYADTTPRVSVTTRGLAADGSRFDTTLTGWNTSCGRVRTDPRPYPPTPQVMFSRRHTQKRRSRGHHYPR